MFSWQLHQNLKTVFVWHPVYCLACSWSDSVFLSRYFIQWWHLRKCKYFVIVLKYIFHESVLYLSRFSCGYF